MIKAECHSDDHKAEIAFDATSWFEQASDKEIAQVVDCNWGGDYPTDNIAIYMSDYNEEIAKMFIYLEIAHNQGFECCILDTGAAVDWIKENRPDIYLKLEKLEEDEFLAEQFKEED
jgi:hypothetical protein